MGHKPDGYSSVSPYVIVDDPAVSLAFVGAVFGAEPLRPMTDENGAIRHVEAMVEGDTVMFGAMPGAPGVHIHVYVPDVDSAFQKAMAAGGTEVEAPGDQSYGDRRAAVRDPSGTTWWLATHGAAQG